MSRAARVFALSGVTVFVAAAAAAASILRYPRAQGVPTSPSTLADPTPTAELSRPPHGAGVMPTPVDSLSLLFVGLVEAREDAIEPPSADVSANPTIRLKGVVVLPGVNGLAMIEQGLSSRTMRIGDTSDGVVLVSVSRGAATFQRRTKDRIVLAVGEELSP